MLPVSSVPVADIPSDWRYGATVVSICAIPLFSGVQLSAAVISVREKSIVTYGPGIARFFGAVRPADAAMLVRRIVWPGEVLPVTLPAAQLPEIGLAPKLSANTRMAIMRVLASRCIISPWSQQLTVITDPGSAEWA